MRILRMIFGIVNAFFYALLHPKSLDNETIQRMYDNIMKGRKK